jgi:hypothetical protein
VLVKFLHSVTTKVSKQQHLHVTVRVQTGCDADLPFGEHRERFVCEVKASIEIDTLDQMPNIVCEIARAITPTAPRQGVQALTAQAMHQLVGNMSRWQPTK